MKKIEFIKNGENVKVGKFSKGDKGEYADDIANVLIKRDKVAKEIKTAKEPKKSEVIDNG
jgi:hypothetical protein